jgi:aldose 1-epimerase
VATVRLVDPSGTGVEMVWDQACPWVQIHTADRPPLADGAAPIPVTAPASPSSR